jgi:hypothetical protein
MYKSNYWLHVRVLWELGVIHKMKMTLTLGMVYCFNSSHHYVEQCSTDYTGTVQVTG